MFIHFIPNGFSLHSNYKITNKVTIHMGIRELNNNIMEFMDKHNTLIMVQLASYEKFGAQLIIELLCWLLFARS